MPKNSEIQDATAISTRQLVANGLSYYAFGHRIEQPLKEGNAFPKATPAGGHMHGYQTAYTGQA